MDVGSLFQKFLEQEKRKKRKHNNDDDDDDDDAKLDAFFTTPKDTTKRLSRKKRQYQIRKLMKQAKSIIEGFPTENKGDDDDDDNQKIIGGGGNPKKKTRTGGAKENPLKKEIANLAGLDFANQVGALLAQPTQINMVPPADQSRKSTQPEKIPSGVKTESKKVLEPKSNIYDINMQG